MHREMLLAWKINKYISICRLHDFLYKLLEFLNLTR